MSKNNRRRQSANAASSSEQMLAKARQELAAGFLEVEITGISFRRLCCAYRVLFRGAWAHTLDSLRSLLRPTPAV